MSINNIVTPLDSAVLETKEQYRIYYKIIKHAFHELVESITENNICNDYEATFIKQYGKLITYSLEAFRIKYLYNEEEKMRIDLTQSGFPNYLEFRYLLNDLKLKHEHLDKLPKIEDLKTEFLEQLIKQKKLIPEYKLHQAASTVYYSTVDRKFIFKRFVQGKIIKPSNDFEAEYMVSWSFYDITLNRPFVCFMYFDLHKEDIEDYTEKIYNTLESIADRDMSLDMMAYAIDKRLPKVWPKSIKKIDLGPIHNVFAKDEMKFTHCILEAIVNKTLDLSDYAISLSIEELVSKGNFSEGSFFKKQYLQIWEEPQNHKYVFAPHKVMQVLYDTIPDSISSLTKEPFEIADLKL